MEDHNVAAVDLKPKEAESRGSNSNNSISKEEFGKLLYGLTVSSLLFTIFLFRLFWYLDINHDSPRALICGWNRCDHYRRRCKLRAPCCNKIFTCRHCHNDATSSLRNPNERHELVRHEVKQVICAVCDTEQQVSNFCSNCGVKFGEYFCNICKFYDDDTSKEQFHCNDCRICRVGGRENFFHCQKCGSCYSVGLRDNHICVENSMKNHCPICYEFLFDSIKGTTIMKCGHTMHTDCYTNMLNQDQYRCPICSKSVLNMSRTWERLDQEIEATTMPEEYHYEVLILCNDCNTTGKAFFHILGHKCRNCNSYNTRMITNGENRQ